MRHIQLEFDFGLERRIGDLVRIPEESKTQIFEIIEVIPEEDHYLPYGVILPNPEMYQCKGLDHSVYGEDTELVGRYVG